jgi:hypothetical protein
MSQWTNQSPHDRPRYLPQEPFPPYAFVSGHQPHPISDPAGHSYGVSEQRTTDPEEAWASSRPYLRGLDLFNHGFYWEAHEAWEGLWKHIDRNDPRSAFLQGLIHLAAAGVKVREGKPAGVRSHALRAEQLFRRSGLSLYP